jgi:hypothetical protein
LEDVLEGFQSTQALFAGGGRVATDPTKRLRPGVPPEAAEDFLLQFAHADVPLGLVMPRDRTNHKDIGCTEQDDAA